MPPVRLDPTCQSMACVVQTEPSRLSAVRWELCARLPPPVQNPTLCRETARVALER